MITGKVYLYKGRPVLVTDGQVLIDGKVSNFWVFFEINEDGSLGKRCCDYNNGDFVPTNDYKILVVKKENK